MNNTEFQDIRFHQLTATEICSVVRNLNKHIKEIQFGPFGVVIVAGESAYSTVRKAFPEDTETIKVKLCSYLEKDQCFAIRNPPF